MKRPMVRVVLGFVLGAQTLLFQNCSNAKFTQDDKAMTSLVNAESCDPGIIDTNRNVKILMVVDASGSNQQQQDGTAGTDPERKWRLSAINSLVNRYGNKNNFHFGLATFQGKSSQAQIRNSVGEGVFTNNSAAVQEGISNFIQMTDGNGTPYTSALTLAQSIIKNDMLANPADNAIYSVVFISDGMPDDISSTDTLKPYITDIMKLSPGQVNANSVFYYNTSSQLQNINTKYLRAIAEVGKGSFITANANQSIQLDDMIQVSSGACN